MDLDEYSLRQMAIHDLRNYARSIGLTSSTTYKKEELVNHILKLQSGEEKPIMPKSRQGRPPMSKFVPTLNSSLISNEKYVSFQEILKKSEPETKKGYLDIARSCNNVLANNEYVYCKDVEDIIEKGYFVVVDDEFGFVFNLSETDIANNAVFVPQTIIKSYKLLSGDLLEYKCNYVQNSTSKFVYEVVTINGSKEMQNRVNFNKLQLLQETNSTIKIESENSKTLTFKNGSRNILIVNNANQIKLLRKEIEKNLNNYYIINLLVDVMPEDVPSLTNAENIENFFTCVGESNKIVIQTIVLAIERAKRLVEQGNKVIIIASEAKRIVKQTNFMLGYNVEDIKYKSLDLCYKLLCLARLLENGGEITTLMLFKQDYEQTNFERYILDEFSSLSCNIIK